MHKRKQIERKNMNYMTKRDLSNYFSNFVMQFMFIRLFFSLK